MTKLFRKLDRFGSSPSLNISTQDRFHTNCGAVLTILAVGYLISILMLSGQDMVLKTNPNVFTSENPVNSQESVKLSNMGFNIGIALAQVSSTNLTPLEGIYKVSAQLFKPPKTSDEIGEQQASSFKLLPTRPCEPSDFNLNFPVFGYCIALEEVEEDVEIKLFEEQFLVLSLAPCIDDPEDEDPQCEDLQTVKQEFSYSYVYAYTSDGYIDPSNFRNPISREMRIDAFKAPGNEFKSIRLELQKAEFESDKGWLYSTHENFSTQYVASKTVDGYKAYEEEGLQEASQEIQFMLSLSPRLKRFNREYKKVDDVLGDVTGVAAFVVIILMHLFKPYLDDKANEFIYNKIYQVEKSDRSSKFRQFRQQEHSGKNLQDMVGEYESNTKKSGNQDYWKVNYDGGQEEAKEENQQQDRTSNFISEMDEKVDNSAPVQTYREDIQFTNQKVEKQGESPRKNIENEEQNGNEAKPSEEGAQNQEQPPKKLSNEEKANTNNVEQIIESPKISEYQVDKRIVVPEDEEQFKIGGATKVQVGIFEWIGSKMCRRKTKKVQILEEARADIEDKLDLCTVIKRIHEVELLQKILFTKDQRNLFKFLAIPGLNFMDKEKKGLKFDPDDLLQQFKTNKRQMDDIDRKLIKRMRRVLAESQYKLDEC